MALEIDVREVDGVQVLDLSGELAEPGPSNPLMETMLRLLSNGERRYVLNLQGVSCSNGDLGVQQILPVCTSVRTRGGHVVQLDVPESLMEAYDSFVALPNLIGPFYEDESEAIEALKSRSSS